MGEQLDRIKGFVGLTVGAVLGGQAIQAIGNIGSGMSSGMRGATQSMVGVGLLGHAASLSKSIDDPDSIHRYVNPVAFTRFHDICRSYFFYKIRFTGIIYHYNICTSTK